MVCEMKPEKPGVDRDAASHKDTDSQSRRFENITLRRKLTVRFRTLLSWYSKMRWRNWTGFGDHQTQLLHVQMTHMMKILRRHAAASF